VTAPSCVLRNLPQQCGHVEKLKLLKLERQIPIGACEIVNMVCDWQGLTKEAVANQMPKPLPQRPAHETKEEDS
jgi:hypothetical protein